MSSARSAMHEYPTPGLLSSARKRTPKSVPRLEPSPLPLQPIENSSSARTPVAASRMDETRRPSPMKPRSRRSTSHYGKDCLSFIPISAPPPPTFVTDSPAKKPPYQSFHHSQSRSGLFTTFPSINPELHSMKRNSLISGLADDGFAEFPEPSYRSHQSLKRTLLDAAPLKERPIKKSKRRDSTPGTLVNLLESREIRPVDDDGTKPPYSYAMLIGMSILRAPNRRLTLAQIYKWISDSFKYYRSCDPGWQNSIRHNLSLNKAFVKQERPKDDPGKGNYWAIEPGMEAQFLKDKSLRYPVMSSIPLPAAPLGHNSNHLRDSGLNNWTVPTHSSCLPAPKQSKSVDLSSDATLPASDPALQEDTSEEGTHIRTSVAVPPRSSPPQHIHSSPPVVPPLLTRHGTPPSPSHTAVSFAPRERTEKYKSTAANDSGYFSSLESSAMRSDRATRVLTSDLDVEPPRIKRGRAEEEIARIRSSSHDVSPRHTVGRKGSKATVVSSPSREEYISMLPPPLTPVIKNKKPVKPPASLSPNTNLRNHRKRMQHMVHSPIKHLGLTDDELPFSPAFKIQDELLTPGSSFHASFDVFADAAVFTPAYGSPEKRIVRGSRPEAVGSVLADITTINGNSRMDITSFSYSKSKDLRFSESPSKNTSACRFTDTANDDFFSFHLFDDSPGEVDGVDFLQGFQKIGGTSKDESSRGKYASRRL